MLLSAITFPRSHIGRKLLLSCIWRPRWGWSPQICARTLGDEKLEWWAYQMVKEFRWYVQPLWHNTRVWQTDRRTDRRTAYTRYNISVARKKTITPMTLRIPLKNFDYATATNTPPYPHRAHTTPKTLRISASSKTQRGRGAHTWPWLCHCTWVTDNQTCLFRKTKPHHLNCLICLTAKLNC